MPLYQRVTRILSYNEQLLRILTQYPIRKPVLDYLSAYDVAKLNAYLGDFLTATDKTTWLNPMRDLFWDVAVIERLLQEGLELVLLGNDLSVLGQRLRRAVSRTITADRKAVALSYARCLCHHSPAQPPRSSSSRVRQAQLCKAH